MPASREYDSRKSAAATERGSRTLTAAPARTNPVTGTPFAETADLSLDEWSQRFNPRAESGPVPPEQLAGHVALEERRAVHERYRVTSMDGVERDVAVTAFPLFAQGDEFVGIVVIFWRE